MLLVVTLGVIVFSQGGVIASDVIVPDDVPSRVVDLDFAFDGGSLLVTLIVEDEHRYLLIVANDSPVLHGGFAGPMKMLWGSDIRFGKEHSKSVTIEDVRKLVRSLAFAKSEKLNQDIASILLARSVGLEINLWGSSAIEAINGGNWLTIFFVRENRNESGTKFK